MLMLMVIYVSRRYTGRPEWAALRSCWLLTFGLMGYTDGRLKTGVRTRPCKRELPDCARLRAPGSGRRRGTAATYCYLLTSGRILIHWAECQSETREQCRRPRFPCQRMGWSCASSPIFRLASFRMRIRLLVRPNCPELQLIRVLRDPHPQRSTGGFTIMEVA